MAEFRNRRDFGGVGGKDDDVRRMAALERIDAVCFARRVVGPDELGTNNGLKLLNQVYFLAKRISRVIPSRSRSSDVAYDRRR